MANKRNKSIPVVEGVLRSVETLKRNGYEPTFNSILAHLSSRNILSNHRSLRAYLDAMVKSGMLRLRKRSVKQSNIRPKQVYSLTRKGPLIEVGEKSLIHHCLNWTLPYRSSIKAKTDLEGFTRARIAGTVFYGSLEDAVVETLAKTQNTGRFSQTLTFCTAMLATKNVNQNYLMLRAKQKKVERLVAGLLDGIARVLDSPKPEVEDIRTLYEIRNQLAHHGRIRAPGHSLRLLLSPDEMVDAIGKQLGVK
jgi:hypothetical protein